MGELVFKYLLFFYFFLIFRLVSFVHAQVLSFQWDKYALKAETIVTGHLKSKPGDPETAKPSISYQLMWEEISVIQRNDTNASDEWSSDANKHPSGGPGFIFHPFHAVWLHLHSLLQTLCVPPSGCLRLRRDQVSRREAEFFRVVIAEPSFDENLWRVRKPSVQEGNKPKRKTFQTISVAWINYKSRSDWRTQWGAGRRRPRLSKCEEKMFAFVQLFDCFFMHILVHYQHLNCFLFTFLLQKLDFLSQKYSLLQENILFTDSVHLTYYYIFGSLFLK